LKDKDRDRSTQRGGVGDKLVADQASPHYVVDATLSTEYSRKAGNVNAPNCNSQIMLMREKKRNSRI
jgi:hypothetical protein